jgi:hypothetical protein
LDAYESLIGIKPDDASGLLAELSELLRDLEAKDERGG